MNAQKIEELEATIAKAQQQIKELKDKLEGLIIDLDCGTQDAHDALRELLIFLLKELEK